MDQARTPHYALFDMSKLDLALETSQNTATHNRILDAAERLFAEHGITGTSVRSITDLAQVNVAAVNYHFGSKEKLVRAVIDRRLDALEAARAAALDAVEAKAKGEGRAATVVELVGALIAPVFAQALAESSGWPHFIRFVSRLAWEPGAEGLSPPESSLRLLERFDHALQRAVPTLAISDSARVWRLAFMRGATLHAILIITAKRAGRIPKEIPFAAAIAAADDETIKRELIAFVAAGLAAPSP